MISKIYFSLLFILNIFNAYSFTQNVTPLNNSIVNNLDQNISVIIDGNENVSTWINWNDSLVGYWNFDSGNSTHVYDLSGNGNDGFYEGDAISNNTNSIRGNYSDFDGLNDNVNLGDILNDLNNDVSFSFWVKKNDTDNFPILVTDNNPSNSGSYFGFWISILSDNTISSNLGNGAGAGGTNRRTFTTTNSISENTWNHILVTYNSTNNNFNIFLNTENLTGTYSGNSAAFVSQNSFDFILGFRQRFGPNYANGSIDEVMVFNRILSEHEINSLYDSQSNNFVFDTILNNNTNYNYTIYSINSTGNLLKDSYTFYTDTSYILPITEQNTISYYSLNSFLSQLLIIISMGFVFLR